MYDSSKNNDDLSNLDDIDVDGFDSKAVNIDDLLSDVEEEAKKIKEGVDNLEKKEKVEEVRKENIESRYTYKTREQIINENKSNVPKKPEGLKELLVSSAIPMSKPGVDVESAKKEYPYNLDEETMSKVKSLIAIYRKNPKKTMNKLKKEKPFIIDAFHDALKDIAKRETNMTLLDIFFQYIYIILPIFFIIFFLVLFVLVSLIKREKKDDMKKSLSYLLFEIRIHKDGEKEGTPNENLGDIAKSEELYKTLVSITDSFFFEFAVPQGSDAARLFFGVQSGYEYSSIEQINGFFPNINVKKVDDYTIFNGLSSVVGGNVLLKDNYSIPVRTYTISNSDTFIPILNSLMTKQEGDSGLMMQVIVRGARDSKRRSIESIIKKLKKGISFKKAYQGENMFISGINFLFSSSDPKKKEESKDIDNKKIELLESKIKKPLFEVIVRLCAVHNSNASAQNIFNGLTGGFEQFSGTEHK